MRRRSSSRKSSSFLGRVGFLLLFLFFVFFFLSFLGRVKQLLREPLKKEELEVIRVEVLNGSGEEGVAREVAHFLRQKGFDVVNLGNAECEFDQTVVVDRMSPQLLYAKRVAKTLKCKTIISQTERSLLLEVTVIVGKDYRKFSDKLFDRKKVIL